MPSPTRTCAFVACSAAPAATRSTCAIRNSEYAEVFWDPFYRFGLLGDPLVPDREGLLHLPEGPGLGVDIDWDWVDDHTLEVI